MLDRIARSEATIIAAVGEIARRQKRKPAASVRLALVVRHTLYARNYSLRRVGEIHLRAERARISLLFGAEVAPAHASNGTWLTRTKLHRFARSVRENGYRREFITCFFLGALVTGATPSQRAQTILANPLRRA